LSTNLSLPTSTDVKSFWSRPEGKMAILVYAAIIGAGVWFWGTIVPFIVNMLADTLHMVYLAAILVSVLYLAFGKRPQLMFRVLIRKFTSLFVAVYPIEIIEDKLKQMKKRRDKMNDQIALVNGSITQLKRKMAQNASDASKGFGMAQEAEKMAGGAADDETRYRMQLQMKTAANRAQRRQQANIGYASLLERLQKVYKFLTHYATNVDFFIENTQDDIDQKKTEYETTQSAFGAMKQAMSVIKGNATEEDIYDQAFEQIENTVSSQLGVMDDLQRVSQNFMDGVDVQNGAVDDDALKALNAFEQKALTAGGTTDFSMVTTDKSGRSPVPVLTSGQKSSPGDYSDLIS
jgi:hypothetical protein